MAHMVSGYLRYSRSSNHDIFVVYFFLHARRRREVQFMIKSLSDDLVLGNSIKIAYIKPLKCYAKRRILFSILGRNNNNHRLLSWNIVYYIELLA